MVVELISVGTEILLGNIVNTNAHFLSLECAKLGYSIFYQSVVGDNESRLLDVIKLAKSRSDIIILTGGLGPTEDDLTKETTAKAYDLPLIEDAHTKKRIQEYFDFTNAKFSTNNWKQALIPKGSIVFDNQNGTAPGLAIKGDDSIAILLPGPPVELIPMFQNDVLPYLQSLSDEVIESVTVKLCGIGESMAESMVLDIIHEQTNPTIAPYAKTGEMHFRITAKARSKEEARMLIAPSVGKLKERFGDYIYTIDEMVQLEDCVVALLKEKNYSITTAESITAGQFAARFVNVAGVSTRFHLGFITYSDDEKHKRLHVKKETLAQFSAVSKEVAYEMALGAAQEANADVAVAITGMASPIDDEHAKAAGTVFVAIYIKGIINVCEYHLNGHRQKVREQAVTKALNQLRMALINEDE